MFCAVYRSRSSVPLYNGMVYKISNTLTICHIWCQNLSKAQSCAAALQCHRWLSGVSIIRSAQAMLNERTASCTIVCIQRRTELAAPVAGTPDAHRTRIMLCAHSLTLVLRLTWTQICFCFYWMVQSMALRWTWPS